MTSIRNVKSANFGKVNWINDAEEEFKAFREPANYVEN